MTRIEALAELARDHHPIPLQRISRPAYRSALNAVGRLNFKLKLLKPEKRKEIINANA